MAGIIKQVDTLPWENTPSKAVAPVVKQVDKLPWEKTPAVVGSTITRQPGALVTGANYEPGGMDNPNNAEKFNSTGEEYKLFGLFPTGIRIQRGSDQNTYLVQRPKGGIEKIPASTKTMPDGSTVDYPASEKVYSGQSHNPIADTLNKMSGAPGADERIITGVALDTIRGTADLAMWLGEKISSVNTPMAAEEIKKLRESFDKNFPRVAAANESEKLVTEIADTVVGYLGGNKVTKDAVKTVDLAPQYLKFLSDWFVKTSKGNPADAKAGLDLIIRALIKETGGNIGASALTPDNTDSLSQKYGGLPQDIGGDDYAADKLGQFADNTAFSMGAWALGKLIARTWSGAGRVFKVLKNIGKPKVGTEANTADMIIQTIDEGFTPDMPPEEAKRRIEILGDILKKNKSFQFMLAGNKEVLNLDSNSAIMLGAQEYMQRVYAGTSSMGTVTDEFINTQASNMIQRVNALKQAVAQYTSVNDGRVLAGFGGAMKDATESVATGPLPSQFGQTGAEVAGKAATDLGTPVAEGLNTVRPTLKDIASSGEEHAIQRQDQLMHQIAQARKEGNLGSTAEERATMSQQTNEVLYDNLQKDMTTLKDKWANIPDIKIDPMEVAKAIQAAGDTKGVMTLLGVSPNDPSFVQAVSGRVPKGGGKSELDLLAETIEKHGLNSLKTLINDVRPKLAIAKDNIWKSSVNKETAQADSLLNYIEQKGRSAGDEFSIAMDETKRFNDKWTNTPGLRNYVDSVRNERSIVTEGNDWKPVEEFTKGDNAISKAGMDAFEAARNSSVDGDMKAFMNALYNPELKNDKTMAKALVGMAIKNLSTSKDVSSNDIISAIQPILKDLERMGDTESIKMFDEAVQTFRQGEAGLIADTAENATKMAEYNTKIKEAENDIALNFVYRVGGQPAKAINPQSAPEAFKSFFDKPNLVDNIDTIVSKAKAEGNEMVVRGIKNQFLTWVFDRIKTSKPLANEVTPDGLKTVRAFSNAQLVKILEGRDGDTTLPAMMKLFSDDKETAQGTIYVMNLLSTFLNGKAAKPMQFGSDTVVNNELQKTVNLMITLTMGVLNPTATKARGIANRFLESSDGSAKAEAVKNLLGNMLNDPDYFRESLDLLAKDKTGDTFIKKYLAAQAMLNKQTIRGAMTYKKPTKKDTTDQQTNEAIPTDIQGNK